MRNLSATKKTEEFREWVAKTCKELFPNIPLGKTGKDKGLPILYIHNVPIGTNLDLYTTKLEYLKLVFDKNMSHLLPRTIFKSKGFWELFNEAIKNKSNNNGKPFLSDKYLKE
ncbi:MAG: hypothetical protein IJK72_00100 [Mycoplasma sp.]|nr:hypothetical protein [Mycoplasma sp.]MBQ6954929.1 hypothetical protein [Mycoplasma sp.]